MMAQIIIAVLLYCLISGKYKKYININLSPPIAEETKKFKI
jgi:hypothetical protein